MPRSRPSRPRHHTCEQCGHRYQSIYRGKHRRCDKCLNIKDKTNDARVASDETAAHSLDTQTNPTQNESTVHEIVLLRPWENGYNDSWLVSYDGPYSNDRPRHISVGRDRMGEFCAGQRFILRNLHTVGPATMWEVADTDMHFTVTFQRYAVF